MSGRSEQSSTIPEGAGGHSVELLKWNEWGLRTGEKRRSVIAVRGHTTAGGHLDEG